MPSHRGSGYRRDAAGFSTPLQGPALRDVGDCALVAGLFVVPEGEADRSVGTNGGIAEKSSQFHYQGRAGRVIVRALIHAMPVHMCADDVHLVRPGSSELGAIHLLTLTIDRLFAVHLADPRVRLLHQIAIHSRSAPPSKDGRPARSRAFECIDCCSRRRIVIRVPRRDVRVGQTFNIGAAVGLELRLDPVHRVSIASRPLAAIAEFAERFDG
jgi:hypothetical protein